MEMKKIIDFIIAEGTEKTNNGAWRIFTDELAGEFNLSEDTIIAESDAIWRALYEREEVADVDFVGDSFDLVFWLSYCKDWDGTDDWGCI